MNPRQLILLSPYRLPAKDSVQLADEDVAAFLNGYTALWHPLALRGALEPPRVASPYDYESPSAGHVYAVPDSPPMFLPDDWDQRVTDAGACAFRAGADREGTLANLLTALASLPFEEGAPEPFAAANALTAEQVRPFFGVGLGYAHILALFEAMDHENLLAGNDLWEEVQQAAEALFRGEADACRQHLQAVADRLLSAREALYPVTVHLLDLYLLDDAAGPALPEAFERGSPVNLITSGTRLEQLAAEHPEVVGRLKEGVAAGQVEACVGAYVERADALLPVESQLWNLVRGVRVARDVLGADVQVFGRKRVSAHPQLPLLLQSAGLRRALLISFDDSSLPSFQSAVVTWPAQDGSKQVEAFTRAPYRADAPLTFFNLAYYLHRTIAQDSAATLALLHQDRPAGPWYGDWLELNRFAPVLGRWTTLGNYFNEVLAGEQASASSADDFTSDALSDRAAAWPGAPVTGFARHARLRRRLDTAWSLAALQRGLAGANDPLRLDERLTRLEDLLEAASGDADGALAELDAVQDEALQALASRLLSRATGATPGHLLLNPCSFARRLALELPTEGGPLPVEGAVKACQVENGQARLVVEVPALGFAWLPRNGPPGTPPQKARMRLADERHVRNEFFEAEIDPATGGLRGLWDHRTQVSRLGQQLVYNPGSTMRATAIRLTSAGPALGEVVSEGEIADEQGAVLATFRQRYRAWLGRPVLDLRVEIELVTAPTGYPWHTYYGARFAWRDERTVLLRGVCGTGYVTTNTRPETPDFLELRLGRANTVIFPGGLPFHQRHGARMLDVLLIPDGETGRAFDLALALDRDNPMLTALGYVSPVPLLPVEKGPPHIGSSGWLFHLDAPNLLLTGFRPAPDGADAVQARLLECALHYSQAEFRCARNPTRAALLDARGEHLSDVGVSGDAALFELAPGDFSQLRVEFS